MTSRDRLERAVYDNELRLAYAIIHSELIALKGAHLYWAMRANNLSLFEAILTAGGPPTLNGLSLLVFVFTCFARIDFAHLLLQRLNGCAKKNVVQAALYYAHTQEHVAFCIENGAEIDALDLHHSEAALVFHVADLRAEAVRALVACGASTSIIYSANWGWCLLPFRTWLTDYATKVAIVAALRCATDRNEQCFKLHDHAIDETTISDARRSIARCRVDFVRQRAAAVCIALHGLPALVLCGIMEYACEPFANIVPFHCFWNIAVCVKHYRSAPKPKAAATAGVWATGKT